MRIRHLAPAVLLATLSALPAAAQTLKPGLWEITSRSAGNPQADQAMAEMRKQLESMPPEQRKQMEAMMAGRGVQMAPGSAGGMAARVCMTKDMVERNEVPQQQGDCRTTRQQRSGSTVSMAFACSNPPSTGDSTITIASPEAFSSRTRVTTTQQGRPETLAMEASGKWLGADCGAVKPMTGR
jgi:hypothetical protein